MDDFDEALMVALDRLEPGTWAVVFKDSTSPKPELVVLSGEVLDRGIGEVGSINIPPFIWHAVVPEEFSSIATRRLQGIRPVSGDGLRMARALVRDGVLRPCGASLPANGWLFPVPKNHEKASMIVHLVKFNDEHTAKPASFTLPVVEDLAFLISVHHMSADSGLLTLAPALLQQLNDPFLQALDRLRLVAPPGAPLLACHVDLKNAFWSLRLPPQFQDSFRVEIEGTIYGFSCLPFGWQFSPAICQTVLGFILERLSLVSVLVLHYLDDFLIVGYGSDNVRSAAHQLCSSLRLEGAIISPKSVLEPVPELDWLGKHLVLSGARAGVYAMAGGWQILVGLWLRTAVLPLSRQQARRVVGRFSWALRPQVGACPFLAGWRCHVLWGDSFVRACPRSLVLSLLHCLVMVRRGWVPSLIMPPPPVNRGLVFVDAAFDINQYKVGLWGPAFGGRIFKCSAGVRTQQEAELDGVIKGVRFVVNVGWPNFRLVGDNAASLEQAAGMRASSGLFRHNRQLRRLFYLSLRAPPSTFLEWVPGDLNPADCFSRIDSDFGGSYALAAASAWNRFQALLTFPDLPCPVWALSFPKGRLGAARNLLSCNVGAGGGGGAGFMNK